MKYIVCILLIVCSFAAHPQEEDLVKQRLKKQLPQTQSYQNMPSEIQFLQGEIRKLNSQIIDLKVERDKWRTRAIEMQEVQHNHMDDMLTTYQTYLLLIQLFEDHLIENGLELPIELQDIRSDIQVELAALEQQRGN